MFEELNRKNAHWTAATKTRIPRSQADQCSPRVGLMATAKFIAGNSAGSKIDEDLRATIRQHPERRPAGPAFQYVDARDERPERRVEAVR